MRERQELPITPRELKEKLAVYRELSPAEREAVERLIAQDPEAAALLAAYREMDRKVAALPDPAPDPALAAGFRRALAEAAAGGRAERASFFGRLGQAPAALGQVAAVGLLLLLVTAAGLLFRDQFQAVTDSGLQGVATPVGDRISELPVTEQIQWRLVEVGGEEIDPQAVDPPIELHFYLPEGEGLLPSFDTRGFCTEIDGTVRLGRGSIFEVWQGTSRPDCPESYARYDEAMVRALRDATALHRDGKRLEVVDAERRVRLRYEQAPELVDPAFQGTEWELISLAGEQPHPAGTFTLLILGTDLFGESGCNDYHAEILALNDGIFALAELRSTTGIVCEEPPGWLMAQEEAFLDALRRVVRYAWEAENELALSDARGNTIMSFRRAGAAPMPTGTPTPAGPFPGPTPTPAVAVDPEAPFAPFRDYMLRWPAESGMAHGALRAGMIAYLEQIGSIDALNEDPALLADLESRLRPAVPTWNEFSLYLFDAYPEGGLELIAGVLPYVDVYSQDATGAFRVRGGTLPRYLPVEGAWPARGRIVDVTGEGDFALFLVYEAGEEADRAAEAVMLTFDPDAAYTAELWRGYVPALAALPAGAEPFAFQPEGWVVTTCPAVGVFDPPVRPGDVYERPARRDVYVWNGAGYVPLLTERDAPSTQREQMNVAEAALRAGELGEALARYRLLSGETGLPAGAREPDWQTLAAFRAGQIHALLGERANAEEMLRQARLSSTQLGRAAGVFGEAYEERGNVVSGWAALLADRDLLQALVAAQNGLAGGAGDPLALYYPGMALAAALGDLDPADLGEGSLPELLGRWQTAGLAVGSGRLADVDGDGVQEIVVAQPVPSLEEADYVQVSLLEHGAQGWYALPLGQLADAFAPLPAPRPGPANGLAMEVGGVYAVWDGAQLRFYQTVDGNRGFLLESTRPDRACPLPAAERQAYEWEWQEPPAPTPTRVLPTLSAPEMTATAAFATFAATRGTPTPYSLPAGYPGPSPTPTPWDQEGLPAPPPTPTMFPGTLSPPTPTQYPPVPGVTPTPTPGD